MKKAELAKKEIENILKEYGVTIGTNGNGEPIIQELNPKWELGNDEVFCIDSSPIENTPF